MKQLTEPKTAAEKKQAQQQRQAQKQAAMERRSQPSDAEQALQNGKSKYNYSKIRQSKDPSLIDEMGFKTHFSGNQNAQRLNQIRQLLYTLILQGWSKELHVPSMVHAISDLAGCDWVRPIEQWVPAGKSDHTQWKSLIKHLLFQYPMPEFFCTPFMPFQDVRNQNDARIIFALLGQGSSMYKLAQSGIVNAPLTRKMCHEFMTLRGEHSYATAVHTVQANTFGLSHVFRQALLCTSLSENLRTRPLEAKIQEWIQWLGQNAMFPAQQVGPMWDYIRYQINQDANYVIFGRTPQSVLRAMETWHAELNRVDTAKKRTKGATVYNPSGIRPMEWKQKVNLPTGGSITRHWRMQEILTLSDLQAEGRALSHCVVSYASYINSGETSIWSLQCADHDPCNFERDVTIEVRNVSRKIVQIRGKYNRKATGIELKMINEWAGGNDLTNWG